MGCSIAQAKMLMFTELQCWIQPYISFKHCIILGWIQRFPSHEWNKFHFKKLTFQPILRSFACPSMLCKQVTGSADIS